MRRTIRENWDNDYILGTASHDEEYPWLNKRHYEYRLQRELDLFDEPDPTRAQEIVEMAILVDNLIQRAKITYHLTLEEESCFKLSASLSVEEIGRKLQLGPKTVRRRILCAVNKIQKVVSEDDP